MSDKSDRSKEEDIDLFRRAMQGVTPLKPDHRIKRKPARKKPLLRTPDDDAPEMAHRFTDDFVPEECPDRLYFERPGGVQKSVLKKLRSGKFAVDSSLDLHGLTVEQARQQLTAFMAE